MAEVLASTLKYGKGKDKDGKSVVEEYAIGTPVEDLPKDVQKIAVDAGIVTETAPEVVDLQKLIEALEVELAECKSALLECEDEDPDPDPVIT